MWRAIGKGLKPNALGEKVVLGAEGQTGEQAGRRSDGRDRRATTSVFHKSWPR